MFFVLYFIFYIIWFVSHGLRKSFDTWDQILCHVFVLWMFCEMIWRQRRRITNIISDIMCKRKENFTMERYLLGHLLNYNDEKGQMLSDDQIAECNWGPIWSWGYYSKCSNLDSQVSWGWPQTSWSNKSKTCFLSPKKIL